MRQFGSRRVAFVLWRGVWRTYTGGGGVCNVLGSAVRLYSVPWGTSGRRHCHSRRYGEHVGHGLQRQHGDGACGAAIPSACGSKTAFRARHSTAVRSLCVSLWTWVRGCEAVVSVCVCGIRGYKVAGSAVRVYSALTRGARRVCVTRFNDGLSCTLAVQCTARSRTAAAAAAAGGSDRRRM